MDLSHALHLPKGISDPILWVIFALVIFIGVLLFLQIHKQLGKALDDRAQKISHELEEARKLREQAQELLASYQRRQREAEQEAQSIIDQAQKEVARMADSMREVTRKRLEKRAEMAKTKIAYAEQEAIRQVRNIAIDLAVNSVEKLFQDQLQKQTQTQLIDQGLKDLSSKLN